MQTTLAGPVQAKPSRKVVLFTSSYGMGGVEVHLLDLARGLVRRGWEMSLICSTRPQIEPLRSQMRRAGVTVYGVSESRNPVRLARRAWRLFEIMRRNRGGVFHLHMQGEAGGDLVLVAARIAGIGAAVRTLHNPPIRPVSRAHRIQVGLSDRLLDRIICVSPETKQAQVEAFNRDRRKSVVITSGVDLERFSAETSGDDARLELGIATDAPVVGTVARLEEERKGISEFIEMAADVARRWPRARFIVVGDGRLRARLEREAADLGLAGRCMFTGYREDVPRLLAAMNVAVFPSSYEAGPYVMLEAMAMTRPVVITPTGLALDLIKPGLTGVLVPFHDPAALSRAVDQLLSDPDLARRLGQAGHDIVAKDFSTDAMVEAVAGLYDELIMPDKSAPILRHQWM